MVRQQTPTAFFWNCLGSALVVASFGVAISVARTETLSLELARYKLKTGSAIERVQKVSNTLEETTKTLPIAKKQKQEIQQKLDESNAQIKEVEAEIEQDIKQFEKTNEADI